MEDKYFEQELLKSDVNFESNKKTIESLNLNLNVSKNKDDKKQIESG